MTNQRTTKLEGYTGVYKYACSDGRIAYHIHYDSSRKLAGYKDEGWTPEKAQAERTRRMDTRREFSKAAKIERFDDAAEAYFRCMVGNGKTGESIRVARSRYENHIRPLLGSTNLKNVSVQKIEDLKFDWAKRGLTDLNKASVFTTLSAIINRTYANGDWPSTKNPLAFVQRLKCESRRERALSFEEYERLRNMFKTFDDPLCLTVFEIAIYTGLRGSELEQLRWEDVDLDNEFLTAQTKNKNVKQKTRRVRLHHKVVNALYAWIEETGEIGPSELVFPEGLPKNTIKKTISMLSLNRGLEPNSKKRVTFHTFRHTFATWLVLQGVDIITLRDLLGHHSVTMTERYMHHAPSAGDEAVLALK